MTRGRLSHWLVSQWRHPSLAGTLVLRPLSWLFRFLVAARRTGFRLGLTRRSHLPVPVIVVGNITVGGSGKTPLVIHIVEYLAAHGWRPGVVSRGYGSASLAPRRVDAGSDPADAGDEPVLVALRTGRPVAVGVDRAAAARLLLDDCDVIVADDGLQHYALARDIEIAVVDGDTGLGNGRMLPAGPLREPRGRLGRVDFVAVRDGDRPGAFGFSVRPGTARSLGGAAADADVAAWRGRRVHAVAGIGVPERFFGQLEDAGLDVERHAFGDHHPFVRTDLAFGDDDAVLMTEKDAVKCKSFADERMWFVPAEIIDRDDLAQAVVARLEEVSHGSPTA